MKRYNFKEGDKAKSSATVLEGLENDTHHGVPVTFVGATLYCPACKSLGVLVGTGPRWPDTSMGKEDVAAGKAKQIKGTANDVIGAVKGDSAQQAKGKVQKAVGKIQEKLGGGK